MATSTSALENAFPLGEALSHSEARRVLSDLARDGLGAIPGEVVAELVVRMAGGGPFPVMVAALEALRRRRGFAVRDGLAVRTRPIGRGVLGVYTTAAAGSAKEQKRRNAGGVRPYTTLLESVQPLGGSCDCPDFTKSSLGACKHLLVVLDMVFDKPRLALRARQEQDENKPAPRLTWDPRLALHGEVDRLRGLRLESHGPSRGAGVVELFRGALPEPSQLRTADSRRVFAATLERSISPRGRARPVMDATPSARAVIVQELAQAERLSRCIEEAPAIEAHLRSLQRSLYPFQRQGVASFLRRGRLVLADDMGLGKTTQAIAACHALYAAKKVRQGIVITPASLKPQWLREWHETTNTPAAIVDGTREERKRQIESHRSGFLLMNYEQLLRDAELVRALRPEIVVLDEAQRIKNWATKTAETVKLLTPEYRLVLTGTPMENRIEELASILDWIDDLALAPQWRLAPLHLRGDNDTANEHGGVQHLGTLRKRLQPCLVRRTRAQVLTQLPRRRDTRVPVEMLPQQREEHDALMRPIARLVAAARRRPLRHEEFLRLMQLFTRQRVISNGLGQLAFDELWPTYARARPDAALLDGLFAPKLVELRRLIADLAVAQRRKVVVFSQWRRMLRLAEWSVRDVLGDADLGAVFFTGAESGKARTRNIVEFHDDPRTAVMFLSDAGGVGLNLQRAASACINLELPWNPAVLEQRVSRIHRIGQRAPIDVYHLVNEYGIEARIADLVGNKRAFFSALFDGTTDEVKFDRSASFLGRLEAMVGGWTADARGAELERDAEPDDADAIETHVDTIESEAIADDLPPPPTLRSDKVARGSNGVGAADGSGERELLPGLRVRTVDGGGLRIDASKEAAEALLPLLEGLTKLLAATVRKGVP